MRRTSAIALWLLACSGGEPAAPRCAPDTAPEEGGAGGMPCDVHDVVARKCQGCHGDPTFFGAPMPLLTYDDLAGHAAAIQTNIHGGATPMPPPPDALADSDRATLDGWFAQGMPHGLPCVACPIERPGPVAAPSAGDCTLASANLELRASAPFAIPSDGADVYGCYAIQVHTVPAALEGVHALDVLLHMHLLGVDMQATLQPSGGEPTWENPSDQTVSWGFTLADEMFYAYFLAYPKVSSSTWPWDTPARQSTCTSTTQ